MSVGYANLYSNFAGGTLLQGWYYASENGVRKYYGAAGAVPSQYFYVNFDNHGDVSGLSGAYTVRIETDTGEFAEAIITKNDAVNGVYLAPRNASVSRFATLTVTPYVGTFNISVTWSGAGTSGTDTLPDTADGGDTVSGDLTAPAGYKVYSAIVDGVELVSAPGETVSISFTMPSEDTVVTTLVAPDPPAFYVLTGTITYVGSDCPSGTLALPVNEGGAVFYSGGQELIAAPGTINATPLTVTAGDSASIFASSNDIRTRISVFIVDGVDMLLNPTALPDSFAFTGPNAFSGGVFWTPAGDSNFSVTFVSDRMCYRPTSGLPPTRMPDPIIPRTDDPVPPVPEDPRIPPTVDAPDPDDPRYWPPWFPPTKWPIPPEPPTPPTPPDPPPPVLEPPGNPPPPVDEPPNPPRVRDPFAYGRDWASNGRDFFIQWKDDGQPWSKEHYISIGERGETNLFRTVRPMGEYRVRQYKIVVMTLVPTEITYIEENNRVIE